MNKIDRLFPPRQSDDWKLVLAMAVGAYAFVIFMRLIWVDMFSGVEQYYWNGVLMINTNDGYQFAEGARDLMGLNHVGAGEISSQFVLAKFTYYFSYIWPFSFEAMILYMPAIFGSLLVIPVLLMGRTLGVAGAGLVGALIAGIAWSYYNRTMTGYYDTDLLIVVLPALMTWAYVAALHTKQYLYLVLAPSFAVFAMQWHSGGWNLANAIFYLSIGYLLLFDRQNRFNYKFLSVFAVALLSLPVWGKLVLIAGLTAFFYALRERITDRMMYAVFAVVAILYFYLGGYAWLNSLLGNVYLVRAIVADELNLTLKYFGVVNTVREAGQIPFETFANRISGHTVALFLSALGYLLILIRYPVMLLTLPMVGLGFFAVQGGLRFTVFAVPWMALGLGYLIFLVGKFMPVWPRIVFITAATALALYPHVVHIQDYKVPTVFNKQEVEILDRLKGIADREDYVHSWWDYGYPIRYYSDMRTLVDGGKHDGGSNYPVSFALSFPNIEAAAKMARLDVEMTELNQQKPCGLSIECMLKAYNQPDPTKFIQSLSDPNFPLPEKTRDIYFYLPLRMMDIFPTVKLFSNLDILTGRQYPQSFFYATSHFSERPDGTIDLGNNIFLAKEGGRLRLSNQEVQINTFYSAVLQNNGQIQVQKQVINPNSSLSVIYMQSYRRFLVLDQSYVNSLYIQLFVLGQYDPKLFEPVIIDPLAHVYKLKI